MVEFDDLVITVSWSVNDGYLGKRRPHVTEVKPSDTFDEEEWDEMSEDDKRDHVNECVQCDFNETITTEIDDYEI